MAKKPRVRTLTDSQHVKRYEKLLKSARQYICHLFWSLWKKMSSKNSALVLPKILRLFVSVLTPHDKYTLSVKASVHATNSNASISKYKSIFSIFFCISEIYINLEYFDKKRWSSVLICVWHYRASDATCLRNCRLEKVGLLKCLKSPELEHLWNVNMLKRPKYCLNPIGRILVFLFDYSGRKSAKKILS